jgi:hypothetical protein
MRLWVIEFQYGRRRWTPCSDTFHTKKDALDHILRRQWGMPNTGEKVRVVKYLRAADEASAVNE